MKKAIDFYNAARGNDSHYAMAHKLGVSEQAISQWRKGGAMSPYYAARCAELAGLDVQEAMAVAAAECEKDEAKRSYLRKKLEGVAAGIAIASVTLFLTATPNTVAAQGLQTGQFAGIQIMTITRMSGSSL